MSPRKRKEQNDMTINITEDELLEDNDQKNVPEPETEDIICDAMVSNVVIENKESKLQTSEYSAHQFTEDEITAAQFLHDNFTAYLTKTAEITPESSVKNTIPSGIDLLDIVLGGGLATKLIQFVGDPGTGKSAMVSRIIATGQRKWPGKFISIYIDSEQSMSSERLAQLGVNYPPIKPYSDDMTVERIFKVVEGICTFKTANPDYMDIPSCVIWDSVANTLTEKGMNAVDQNAVLGQKAAALSFLLPKYVNKLNKFNISLICINQLRDKIDMGLYAAPPTLRFLSDKNIPGGKSLLFNTFQLIFLRQKHILDGEYGFEGVIVHAKTIKNKLFTPNIEVELVFSFEHGYSNFWTNYNLLKKTKRITAGGGWVSLPGYSGKKCQQKEVIHKYRTDQEFKKIWDETVQDVLKTEYLDKYQAGDNSQVDSW